MLGHECVFLKPLGIWRADLEDIEGWSKSLCSSDKSDFLERQEVDDGRRIGQSAPEKTFGKENKSRIGLYKKTLDPRGFSIEK